MLVLNVRRCSSGSLRRSSGSSGGSSGGGGGTYTANGGASPATMSSSTSHHSARRRHSLGTHSGWDSDRDDDKNTSDSDSDHQDDNYAHVAHAKRRNSFGSSSSNAVPRRHPGGDMDGSLGFGFEASDGGGGGGAGQRARSYSGDGYTYRWVTPTVRGLPPTRRLAHAAAVVRIMDGDLEGVTGAAACVGKETYMVVFGGMGTGVMYNDVHVLK